ncbi:hypothetical protein Tsubulata_027787, partial [Turnera subulata]
LSSLPDDIELHILPFLDETKSFVRFSAVSKQWKAHLAEPYGKIIEFATSRFVNNLTVNFKYVLGFNGLLRNGLACPSLKTLRLNRCSLGNTFSFPTVTSMHLENCCLDRIDLLLACPNLKELCLVDTVFDLLGEKNLKAGPKLVRLSVEYKRPSKWGITKISAPGLEYFSFVVDHSVEIEYFPAVDDFPSLQCAVIDAAHPTGRFDLIEIIKFLRGLHNTEYLSLSPTLIQSVNHLPSLD